MSLRHSQENAPISPDGTKETSKLTRRALLAGLGVAGLAACAPEKATPTATPVETTEPVEAPVEPTETTEPVEVETTEEAIVYEDEAIGGIEPGTSYEQIKEHFSFTEEDIADGNGKQFAEKFLNGIELALNGGPRSNELMQELLATQTPEENIALREEIAYSMASTVIEAWADEDYRLAEKTLGEFVNDMTEVGADSLMAYDSSAYEGAEEPFRHNVDFVGVEEYLQGSNKSYVIVFDRTVTATEYLGDTARSKLDPELLEPRGQAWGVRVVFDNKLSEERGRPLVAGFTMDTSLANAANR